MFYYSNDEDFVDSYDAMPGGDSDAQGDDLDDGVLESLAIMGLAAALVFLVLYRQQRQQAARRAEENARRQHQQQQQQGGQGPRNPPPQPDRRLDLGVHDFGQWGPGGVGH